MTDGRKGLEEGGVGWRRREWVGGGGSGLEEGGVDWRRKEWVGGGSGEE